MVNRALFLSIFCYALTCRGVGLKDRTFDVQVGVYRICIGSDCNALVFCTASFGACLTFTS